MNSPGCPALWFVLHFEVWYSRMGPSIAWFSVSCDYGVIFSFSMILT